GLDPRLFKNEPTSATEVIGNDASDHDGEVACVEPKELFPRVFRPPMLLYLLDETAAEQGFINDMDDIRGYHEPKREDQRNVHSRINFHRGFLKIAKYRNNSKANPLSTLLTAGNVPQRARRRSASTDRLSSVGLSNSLLVGRITIRVNGMTEPSTIPNQPPEC